MIIKQLAALKYKHLPSLESEIFGRWGEIKPENLISKPRSTKDVLPNSLILSHEKKRSIDAIS